MRAADALSLLAVSILCLPSLAGGAVLLYNVLSRHRIADWGLASSVTTALAALVGMPLLFGAVIVCAAAIFRGGIRPGVHAANVAIVSVSVISMLMLSFLFAAQ